MKMKYYLIGILVAAFGVSSCYDDKGNYDYNNLQYIEIEGVEVGYTVSVPLWDTLKVTPRFIYSNPQDTVMNLEYTWTFAGKTISKERNLVYVVDTIASDHCIYQVEDKDHGVIFVKSFSLSVINKYAKAGYIILSEKNGKSCLNYLPLTWTLGENGNEADLTASCTILENAYKQENREELGYGPMKIHLHRCSSGDNLGGGGSQIMVLQEGSQQLVDVNSSTFLKEVTGDQIFVGGWPAGMKATDVMFMLWSDLIRDEEGQLYSRVKSTDQLFHSEYFLPDPLKYEGQVMKNMRIIPGFISNVEHCLLYDEANKRFFTFLDLNSDFGDQAVGKIIPLKEDLADGGEYPDHFVPLEDLGDYRLVYVGYINPDDWVSMKYFMILEKDGKYYQQEYTVSRDYNKALININGMSIVEIPGGASVIDANSLFYTLPNENSGQYVLIAKGNQLYLYDRNSPPNGIKPYYTCDGNITCMDSEVFRSRILAVGLDNGKVVLLKMYNAKNLQTPEEKFLWQTPDDVDLGHIKDIRYK